MFGTDDGWVDMFGFSDFEEALLSDDGEQVARAAHARLDAMQSRAEAAIRTELSSQHATQARGLLQAVIACRAILTDTSHLDEARP